MTDQAIDRIDEFLAHSDEIGGHIMNSAEEMLGIQPFIFSVMQERTAPFLFHSLGDFSVLRPKSLDETTAELLCVSSAAALGAEDCLRVHIRAALKAGATRDQVLDAILIAAVIGRTSILASSLRFFQKETREKHEG